MKMVKILKETFLEINDKVKVFAFFQMEKSFKENSKMISLFKANTISKMELIVMEFLKMIMLLGKAL